MTVLISLLAPPHVHLHTSTYIQDTTKIDNMTLTKAEGPGGQRGRFKKRLSFLWIYIIRTSLWQLVVFSPGKEDAGNEKSKINKKNQ